MDGKVGNKKRMKYKKEEMAKKMDRTNIYQDEAEKVKLFRESRKV